MGLTIEWFTTTGASIDFLRATDEASDGQRAIDDGDTPETIALELSNGGRAAITGTPDDLVALPTEAITSVSEHPVTHPDGERGKVVSGDPEALECVCGNRANFKSLVSSTAEGIALRSPGTPKPDALTAWPEDEDELHRFCRVCCGRLEGDKTIRETGTAPVVGVMNLTDGTPSKNAQVALDAELEHPSTELEPH